MSLQAQLEIMLANYGDVKTHPFRDDDSTAIRALKGAYENLADLVPKLSKAPMLVKWSAGKGSWAAVPWIAILHSELTTTTEDEFYVVYLFSEDMTKVYLTLAQGARQVTRDLGRTKGRVQLRRRAEMLREELPDLAAAGFLLDNGIAVSEDSTRAKDYEYSTIAYKPYPSGAVPDDTDLIGDLQLLLAAYERLVPELLEHRRQRSA